MQRIVLFLIATMTMVTMNSQTFESLKSPWPKGEPNPYGKYFIGQSYLADVGGGVMNVTFEPGCRNNWHIHHKQVQVLICVAGDSWFQHLTYHKDVQEGASNEWCEPVDDATYHSLK